MKVEAVDSLNIGASYMAFGLSEEISLTAQPSNSITIPYQAFCDPSSMSSEFFGHVITMSCFCTE